MLGAEFVQLLKASATGQVSEWIDLAVAVSDAAEGGVGSLGSVELAMQELHVSRMGAIVPNRLGACFGVCHEDSSCPANKWPKS